MLTMSVAQPSSEDVMGMVAAVTRQSSGEMERPWCGLQGRIERLINLNLDRRTALWGIKPSVYTGQSGLA